MTLFAAAKFVPIPPAAVEMRNSLMLFCEWIPSTSLSLKDEINCPRSDAETDPSILKYSLFLIHGPHVLPGLIDLRDCTESSHFDLFRTVSMKSNVEMDCENTTTLSAIMSA